MDNIVTALDSHTFPVSGPRNPSDISPISLSLSLTPRSSELRSHSQTVPYLKREPAESITDQTEKQKFLNHIFPGNDASTQHDLDLSDLRYDPAQPRKAEGAVSERLNRLISPQSKNVFFQWPSHAAPPGFTRDCRLDIAVIPRNPPASQSQANPVCLDITNIQSCVEHTVTSGSVGRNHNQQHVYAKINELLKCPMNISFIALGIHGSGMILWYADRCGIIEVDLGTNESLRNQAVRGLSNASPLRDPCVSVRSVKPRRIYEFQLHTNVYYGVYGSQGEALYTADGIACRGTLVLKGFRTTAHAPEILAIKLSYPSVPWAAQLPYKADYIAGTWDFEWQVLQLLKARGVRNVPELIDHIEHNVSTNSVREAVGLQDNRHRTRAILITQPLAQCTLRAIENVIELSMLVEVMKDVIDAHQDAWQSAGIAHCDVSLGNIQILDGRGMLADWEFGTPVSELSTDRAVNSGTLETMPPRLAEHRIMKSSSVVVRTVWDEVCSIFLCFISPLIVDDGIRAVDSAGLLSKVLYRMSKLCGPDPSRILQPRHQSNPTIVEAMRNAPAMLFPGRLWQEQPDNANSLGWWDTLRDILNSFVAG